MFAPCNCQSVILKTRFSDWYLVHALGLIGWMPRNHIDQWSLIPVIAWRCHYESLLESSRNHDDVIKMETLPRYWPFVREFTGPRWIPHTKAMWQFLDAMWHHQGQAIIWTKYGVLMIRALGTKFSEVWIDIEHFHTRKWNWNCRLQTVGHFFGLDASV